MPRQTVHPIDVEARFIRPNKKPPDTEASDGFLEQAPFQARFNSTQGSAAAQWNCSSSVEPVRAFTEDEPPWITVVTSSK